MFFNFFRRDRNHLKWHLRPQKFTRNNRHNIGGKCILPQSILEELVTSQIHLPYAFEVSHTDGVYRTNCGVLEFTGEEGVVIVPEWMYQQLDLYNVSIVTFSFKKLPQGTYVKLLPHSSDFLEVEHPKAELEKNLRDYQVLTLGDEIICEFEEIGRIRFTVAKIQPEGDGIYIVDTDLSVEFLEPVGYAEKIEREKTVFPYLEINNCKEKPKVIRMKKFGLYFGYKNFNE